MAGDQKLMFWYGLIYFLLILFSPKSTSFHLKKPAVTVAKRRFAIPYCHMITDFANVCLTCVVMLFICGNMSHKLETSVSTDWVHVWINYNQSAATMCSLYLNTSNFSLFTTIHLEEFLGLASTLFLVTSSFNCCTVTKNLVIERK